MRLPIALPVRPVLARERAVDDDPAAGVGRIVVSEEAPLDERGAHRPQEIVGHDPDVRDRFLADGRLRPIEHLQAGRGGEAGERQEADRAAARHAGSRVEALEQPPEELRAVAQSS